MTTRPTVPPTYTADPATVTAAVWNAAVHDEKLYVQERLAGTNADKSPLAAIGNLVGYYPNLLVNGGLELWNKGVGAFTTSLAMGPDGWTLSLTTVGSVARVAALESGLYAASLVHTSGANSFLYQRLENPLEMRNRQLTLTVRAQTTVVNSFYAQLSDSDGSTTAGTNTARITATGVVQTLTATYTMRAAATVVQVLLLADAASTVTIDSAMLTASNTTSIPYEPEPRQRELMRAQRRYQKIYAGVRFWATAAGQYRDFTINYPVEMAGVPTTTVTAGTRANLIAVPTPSVVTAKNLRWEIGSLAGVAGGTDTYSVNEAIAMEVNL